MKLCEWCKVKPLYKGKKFCSSKCRGAMSATILNTKTAPIIHPTLYDIYWAAGIYEGEGSVQKTHNVAWSIAVDVAQKDPWLLHKLRDLFGGTVTGYIKCNSWRIYGARARGLVMTLYPFLSPRRQHQILKALGHTKIAEEWR